MSTLTTLASFNGSNGLNPTGELISDSGGDLFGTTESGGGRGYGAGGGTVFEIPKSSSGYAAPVTLAAFDNTSGIYMPIGPLVADANGDLYGVTIGRNASSDGALFEIAKTASGYAATPTLMFGGPNGNAVVPDRGLAIDAAGDLFGAVSQGGPDTDGTIVEYQRVGNNYDLPVTLWSFNGTNGAGPSNLIVDASGNIFGTTAKGGAHGDGTVFEIAHITGGYGGLTTLASFNGANGLYPPAGLTMDASGNLFGVTSPGGSIGGATVFEIPHTASGYGALTTLVKFDGSVSTLSPLSLDTSGNLYGTSLAAGTSGMGSVFEIAKTPGGYATSPTTLYNFSGADGHTPMSGVLADGSGNLYGSTLSGGASNDGTVYQLTPDAGSGTGSAPSGPVLERLVTFTGDNGAYPSTCLASDSAGDLFGIAQGGPNGTGVLFEVAKTASGYASAQSIIYDFPASGTGIAGPNSLVVDAAGDIFGTTNKAASAEGAVFEFAKTSSGYAATPNILADFGSVNPAGLIMDSAGNLFGVTDAGGAYNAGSIFEISKTASGYATSPTTLASFNDSSGPSGLVLDGSGNLFGTVSTGINQGQIFEIARTGGGYGSTPVILGSLSQAPSGPLAMDSAGNIFGTTLNMPQPGPMSPGPLSGTVYELAKASNGYAAPTTLANLNLICQSGVIVDGAGNLYGTATGIGPNQVFELAKTASGYAATPTVLHTFDPTSDGTAGPTAGLHADGSGNLFGVTSDGTYYNDGTVFELSNTGFVPASSGSAGGQTLTADGSAHQQLTATGPNATFYAGQNSVVMTEDGGNNLFVYTGLPWNVGEITNFNPATDKIDVSAMLKAAGYAGSDPFGDGTLTLNPNGHDVTELVYNPPGAGSNGIWPIAVVNIDVPGFALNAGDFITGTGSSGNTNGHTLTADGSANQQLTATVPNVTFYPGQNSVVMTEDGGNNLFIYTALPFAAGQITNFNTTTDKIDVSGLLKAVGYSGSDPFGDGTLTLTPNGHDVTELVYHPPGAGNGPIGIVNIDVPGFALNSGDFITSSSASSGGGTGGGGTGGGGTGGGSGTGGGTSGETLVADNSAHQVLTATGPNATFEAGQNSVVMTEDGGNNCFIYDGLPWNAGEITNFNPAADKIDVSAMLKAAGYDGTDPFGDGSLTLDADGHGGTNLIYHPPGAGSNGIWPINVVDIDHVAPGALNPASDFVTGTSGGGGGGASTGQTLAANDTAGQQLTATTPNDTFIAGHNSVVMTGDGGMNSYVFNALPWNAGEITNFNPAADKIDVSAILQAAGYGGADPLGDGTLSLNADGRGGTNLIYHPPGAGSNGIWPINIVDIDHVTAAQFQAGDWIFHH